MSHTSKLPIEHERDALLISFGEHFFSSDRFDTAFDGGMALVEESATYLDSQGRVDAKRLSSEAAFTYATESMRLTTRLMQIASWLLIRRSVNDGDMTAEQALEEESRLKLIEDGLDEVDRDALLELPIKLQDLIMRSHSLHKQIMILHNMLGFDPVQAAKTEKRDVSPIEQNMALLKTAFAR